MVWVNDFQLRFQLRFGNRFQLQLSDSYVGQVGNGFQLHFVLRSTARQAQPSRLWRDGRACPHAIRKSYKAIADDLRMKCVLSVRRARGKTPRERIL